MSNVLAEPATSLSLEEKDRNVSEIKVDKVLRLWRVVSAHSEVAAAVLLTMCHKAAKVPPNNAMPGRAFSLVKLNAPGQLDVFVSVEVALPLA